MPSGAHGRPEAERVAVGVRLEGTFRRPLRDREAEDTSLSLRDATQTGEVLQHQGPVGPDYTRASTPADGAGATLPGGDRRQSPLHVVVVGGGHRRQRGSHSRHLLCGGRACPPVWHLCLDLTPLELKAFSRNGEDGVIQEVLHRIGDGSKTFAEFGIGTGIEGNCVFLAQVLGWKGVFLESDPASHTRLAARYEHHPGVTVIHSYVEPGTINELLPQCGVDPEPAVLSIDVDGNDYYLWEALESVRARLVVIEYNAALDPHAALVQPYSPTGPDGTAYFGASLGGLEALGRRKGYRLVHTELAGVNAFFVREDLAGDAVLAVDEVPRRPPNYYLDDTAMHGPAEPGRTYIVP